MTIYRAEFIEFLDHECYECGHTPIVVHATAWYSNSKLAKQQLPALNELRDRKKRMHEDEPFWDATPVAIVGKEVYDCIQSEFVIEH